MAKTEIALAQALPLAEKIKEAFAPGCERIEIAGSIRRQKQMVGDIELVAIPRLDYPLDMPKDLFGGYHGDKVSLLDGVIQDLLDAKPHFRRSDKNGPLFKNFFLTTWVGQKELYIPIDLFLTTPDQWGLIFAIRTGPADFSKHFVTQAHKYGPLPPGYSVAGGWLCEQGKRISTPDEAQIFDLIGYGWREPTDRENWRDWQRSQS